MFKKYHRRENKVEIKTPNKTHKKVSSLSMDIDLHIRYTMLNLLVRKTDILIPRSSTVP